MSSRRAIGRVIAVGLGICATGNSGFGQQRLSLDLNSGWEFRQAASETTATRWLPAKVPGDVHLDLLANRMIPDPFYRDNEAKLQWIEKADWEYRTTFQVSPEMLQRQHVEIVFEGLDSAADVFVNDSLVLHADNAFREWRAEAKNLLKPGANVLRVAFPSPDKSAAAVAARDPWRTRIGAAEKVYLRKPAYEYGWDWGPKFVTSGIWRPVHLEVWDDARIENVVLHQQRVSIASAHVNVVVNAVSSHDQRATFTVSYGLGNEQKQVAQETILQPGANLVTIPIDIEHPLLWYPAGYGAQPIYKFQVRVEVDRRLADEQDAKTGLRSIELHREPDQWGRSFEFRVNGIPIYAKGADVIPFDSFPNRVTSKEYREVLESARDANMNMIRHWGGGYYETQEFYDICDELGIMVWQDFMFGNEWQPGTYDFKLQVEKEVRYQVARLGNHPSIVLWSGNNETESAFGWSQNGGQPADVRLRMWQDYLTLFSGVIARTVAEIDPERPYWPSSPSADYEETSANYQTGDFHEWTVWHGRADFEEYEAHFNRFISEYGFQSFPEMRTIEAFTSPQDRTSIFTPVMLAHQKNTAGNSIIHDYMLRYFGEPKDFPSFLYASQVLQAEGVKVGAEHWRRIRPRNMGGIYWQLNDCWPVASWASLDYYGRWKALQYYAKRFYAPLLISPHVEDGELAVYVVSDRTTVTPVRVRLRIMDFQGHVKSEQEQNLKAPALASVVALRIPLESILDEEFNDASSLFSVADLIAGGKVVSSNIVFFAPSKNLRLPHPEIKADLQKSPEGYVLHLISPQLARSVYVSFGELDTKLSDNYVNLIPGEQVDIQIRSAESLESLRGTLHILSMADAFQDSNSGVSPSR